MLTILINALMASWTYYQQLFKNYQIGGAFLTYIYDKFVVFTIMSYNLCKWLNQIKLYCMNCEKQI